MTTTYKAESLFDVEKIVAVVTGGGTGIGKVMAHALAANGAAAVYILGRRQEALDAARDSSPNPRVIHTIVCDVTSKDSLAAAAEQVRSEVGYCDVVFANSGAMGAGAGDALQQIGGGGDIKKIQEQLWAPSMDEFTQAFHVNVTGAFYTAVAFLDLLDQGNKRAVVPQKSQIVITSSIAGFIRGALGGFAYAPSKAAATHLAKMLATTFAPLKIRTNVLAPGFYPSEMSSRFLPTDADPRVEGNMPAERVPLARSGREEELAGITLFLTSQAGGYLDGEVLVTDGGSLGAAPSTY